MSALGALRTGMARRPVFCGEGGHVCLRRVAHGHGAAACLLRRGGGTCLPSARCARAWSAAKTGRGFAKRAALSRGLCSTGEEIYRPVPAVSVRERGAPSFPLAPVILVLRGVRATRAGGIDEYTEASVPFDPPAPAAPLKACDVKGGASKRTK